MFALTGVVFPAGAQDHKFQDPRHEGFALSYCGAGGITCGEPVAARFCRSQGFQSVREWTVKPGLDFSSSTIRLDDGGICRGAHCDAFGSITCAAEGVQGRTLALPNLGGQGRGTLITTDRRTTEAVVEAVEYQLLIPGCDQREPGVFLCETALDFQHCRTLLGGGRVQTCRAGLAFDGGFADAEAAEPGTYELGLESTAEVVVEYGRRGEGRVRGEARYSVSFASPAQKNGMWCLQRDRYVYHLTGPKGGLATIDDTADCDVPVAGSFEPHEDHVLQAYDLCEAFGAWGDELEQPMELLVASLFTVGSANPAFVSANRGSTKIIASYLNLKAPMRVHCKD
jgi:hypothetical protein